MVKYACLLLQCISILISNTYRYARLCVMLVLTLQDQYEDLRLISPILFFNNN